MSHIELLKRIGVMVSKDSDLIQIKQEISPKLFTYANKMLTDLIQKTAHVSGETHPLEPFRKHSYIISENNVDRTFNPLRHPGNMPMSFTMAIDQINIGRKKGQRMNLNFMRTYGPDKRAGARTKFFECIAAALE